MQSPWKICMDYQALRQFQGSLQSFMVKPDAEVWAKMCV